MNPTILICPSDPPSDPYEQYEMQINGKDLTKAHISATGIEHYLSKSAFKIKALKTKDMQYSPRDQTPTSAVLIGRVSS